MSLIAWSWVFLVVYLAGMVAIGFLGQRRVRHADDYATARSSYGPLVLALAFAATTASGATFLGGPGLAYDYGLPVLWSSVLYPLGVYLGVLACMRLVSFSGHRFGNRSIPEYLGDRYQSDGIRILVSLYSLVLVFHLTGQLVAGLVMFQTMLGIPPRAGAIPRSRESWCGTRRPCCRCRSRHPSRAACRARRSTDRG